MPGVSEAMRAIITWCGENAPETARRLRPPATRAEIAAAQEATGTTWPDELVELYDIVDGADGGCLLPSGRPLPVAEIVATWRSRQDLSARAHRDHVRQRASRPAWEIAAEQNLRAVAGQTGPPEDPYDVDRHEAQPAGTPAATFLRSFLPIADDGSGGHLVVDLRDGAERGSVTYFDKVDATIGRPSWESVTHMVDDVAAGLHRGSTVQPCWRAIVEDGHLYWVC